MRAPDVLVVLLALAGQGAAHTQALRSSRAPIVPDDGVSAGPDEVADKTGATGVKDKADKVANGVKDAVENPPQSIEEVGSKAQKHAKESFEQPPGAPKAAQVRPSHHAESEWYLGLFFTHAASFLISSLISVALLAFLAILYGRFKPTPNYASVSTERLSWGIAEVPGQGTWRFGLFSCFYAHPAMVCVACCCPSIRWADTMRMAGVYTFWMGFLIFAGLSLLAPVTFGLSGLALLVLATWKRRHLRRLFNMSTDYSTVALDCCTYLCCTCCAIVQEAQQLEEAYAVKHSVLGRLPRYQLPMQH